MDKVVCYGMTRKLYYQIPPVLNALNHNSRPDRIYLMTEDDDIGRRLPENVIVRNVSEQTIFRNDGPNFYQKWSWMVLMKAAISKVFPDEHRILMLDVDTLVNGDISELWSMDIAGCYLAGVQEPYWTRTLGRLYVNMGSVLFDLDALRKDGTDDRIIAALNEKRYFLPEQDCINEICAGKILELPPEYNANNYTKMVENPKIRHFANEGHWWERKEVTMWADSEPEETNP